MLIARAPLRISLGGGGTDLPAYYEQHGGLVVSTTINKYVYVMVNSCNDDMQITSADYQTFYRHSVGMPLNWDGHLALPRAVLHEFGLNRAISLFLASEVPPGTGLGSSSAIAVALVRVIAACLRRSLSRQEIAELACRIELEKLTAPIGKQDQFAAAFGGFNALTFNAERVIVEPIAVSAADRITLDRRLMLFFTGTTRNSAAILAEQQQASARHDGATVAGLHRIKELAALSRACLESGDLDGIGYLLDEGWRQKRRLASGISNSRLDELYTLARHYGALGGKITGAGGGGFLLLYCHEHLQPEVTRVLEEQGLNRMDFCLETRGVTLGAVEWSEEADQATNERILSQAIDRIIPLPSAAD